MLSYEEKDKRHLFAPTPAGLLYVQQTIKDNEIKQIRKVTVSAKDLSVILSSCIKDEKTVSADDKPKKSKKSTKTFKAKK